MRTSWWLGALLALLLAVFAVAPLAYPGFFESSTGFQASFRIQALQDAGLLDATDPVRGDGSLAYYASWPFLWLTGSGIGAAKWGYGLSFLLGALAVYGWARLRLGTEAGVLASAIYTYLPWHLTTVYVRGAYAEAWLWALWPAMVFAWEAPLHRARRLLRLAALVLAVAALLVQPGLSWLFLALMVPYSVAVWRVRWWPARIVAAVAGAGLLAAGGWLAVRWSGQVLPTDFLWPYQLLSATWTEDLAGADLPYQLGAAAVALSIVSLGLWAMGHSERRCRVDATEPAGHRAGGLSGARLCSSLGFWLAALLVILLMTQHPSAAVWGPLQLGSLVAHPWQLLVLAGLPLAFLAGACVRLDQRLAELPLVASLAALAVLASYAYLAPRFTRVEPGAGPVAELYPAARPTDTVHLLETELTPADEITSTLTLTLTWQALAPLDSDYTVFVHLLSGERKLNQADSWPCGGFCPTHEWRPGQIVVDVHDITIPPGSPPGPYRAAVGLYAGETGERLAVTGRDDGTVYLDVR
ncbi:MAG TPA: hypothetical protein PKO09_05535 [Anaerolineae bacterium]|nr:hypothetical protein [Anaerolineae bacterium]